MCGIVGIVNQHGQPADPDLLNRMMNTLAFRGPDEEGTFVEGSVGLGHCRLSVIDLETGRQPMTNEDGTIQLISNNEIYNYQELRSGLKKKGHRFRTRSDTEVILHLYEEKGIQCVEDLQGMFAFALWDRRKKKLFLARDRLGQKPLYFTQKGSAFLFASTPEPLFLYPGVSPEIDPVAVDLYLSLMYIPGPRTIYKAVRKLEPAHWVEWSPASGMKKARYWHLSYVPKQSLCIEDTVERFGEHLEEAVRIRLASDVPLGAFLSGGIDSSLVVALMTSKRTAPLKTFSIGNMSAQHDEVPYARRMSRDLGTEHRVCFFKPSDVNLLQDVHQRCPEPSADPSFLPLYLLSRKAREEVTVVLSGDAGDENFAGYDRYLYTKLAMILSGRFRSPGDPPGMLLTGGASADRDLPLVQGRLEKFLRLLKLPLDSGHLLQFDQLGGVERSALYTEEALDRLPFPRPAQSYFHSLFSVLPEPFSWLDRLLSVDVTSYLSWNILPKVDTATMAHALECRSPFLDHRLMEFVATLPDPYKLRGLTRKYLLKRYGERWLPGTIRKRRKMGFSLPISTWLCADMGDRVKDLLCSQDACASGLFRPEGIQTLLEEHRSKKADRSYLLWSLMMLEQWLRVHPHRLPA